MEIHLYYWQWILMFPSSQTFSSRMIGFSSENFQCLPYFFLHIAWSAQIVFWLQNTACWRAVVLTCAKKICFLCKRFKIIIVFWIWGLKLINLQVLSGKHIKIELSLFTQMEKSRNHWISPVSSRPPVNKVAKLESWTL